MKKARTPRSPVDLSKVDSQVLDNMIRGISNQQRSAFQTTLSRNQQTLPDELRNDPNVKRFIDTGELPADSSTKRE